MPNYLLLIRNAGHFYQRSPEEMQQIIQEFTDWARKLRDEKRMVDANPLSRSGRMLSGQDGRVIDGPFVETKDMIGGYFLIEAKDLEDATAVAKQCPGLKWGETLEVREIGH